VRWHERGGHSGPGIPAGKQCLVRGVVAAAAAVVVVAAVGVVDLVGVVLESGTSGGWGATQPRAAEAGRGLAALLAGKGWRSPFGVRDACDYVAWCSAQATPNAHALRFLTFAASPLPPCRYFYYYYDRYAKWVDSGECEAFLLLSLLLCNCDPRPHVRLVLHASVLRLLPAAASWLTKH